MGLGPSKFPEPGRRAEGLRGLPIFLWAYVPRSLPNPEPYIPYPKCIWAERLGFEGLRDGGLRAGIKINRILRSQRLRGCGLMGCRDEGLSKRPLHPQILYHQTEYLRDNRADRRAVDVMLTDTLELHRLPELDRIEGQPLSPSHSPAHPFLPPPFPAAQLLSRSSNQPL